MNQLARPHKKLDAITLEQWAEKYASCQLAAWKYSDACECFDFWDWLDLNDPDAFEEFKEWFAR